MLIYNQKETKETKEQEENKMYRRAVVDELGQVVKWCNEFKNEREMEKLMNEHIEYTLKCMEV